MSLTKRVLENIDECNAIARELLMEIGAIDTCGMHEFYYNTFKYDNNMLYAIVTNKLKERYPDINDFVLFHKCVGEIMEYAADGADQCPACQKLFEE